MIFNTYPLIGELGADDTLLAWQASSGAVKQITKGNLRLVTRVATIALLKALDVSLLADGDQISVAGFTSANDDGGGIFYYSSSSVAAANGGTVFNPDVGIGKFIRLVNGSSFHVDWWGCRGDGGGDDRDKIQAAIDYASTISRAVVLLGQYKTYAISDYLSINQNYMGFFGMGQNFSRILITSPDNDGIRVGQLAGPSIAIPSLGGFAINRNQVPTGGTGISLIRTAVAKISDIHVDGCQNGFYFSAATNTSISRCIASCGTTAVNFVGFHWDGGQSGTTLFPPASSKMDLCVVDATSCSGTSIGFKIDGNAIADVYLYDCGTLRCSYGRYIDGARATSGPVVAANGAPYNWDIMFMNCTDDEYKVHGFLIANNALIGAITIKAGWSNPGASSGTGSGIYIQNSRGVLIDGHQFMNIGQLATARGVTCDASKNVKIANCPFVDIIFATYLLNSSRCTVTGNTYFNQSSLPGSTAILGQGANRNTITANVVDGYFSSGIADDVTSEKNIAIGNVVDPTNIASPFQMLGAGDISTPNIDT
jgi:Right handed beta helix region